MIPSAVPGVQGGGELPEGPLVDLMATVVFNKPVRNPKSPEARHLRPEKALRREGVRSAPYQ
jgi:hypothetical protein